MKPPLPPKALLVAIVHKVRVRSTLSVAPMMLMAPPVPASWDTLLAILLWKVVEVIFRSKGRPVKVAIST